jgi:hypothetical protein
MKLLKTTDKSKLLKLRREYQQLVRIKVEDFNSKLTRADYEVWVEETRQKIASINRRNK